MQASWNIPPNNADGLATYRYARALRYRPTHLETAATTAGYAALQNGVKGTLQAIHFNTLLSALAMPAMHCRPRPYFRLFPYYAMRLLASLMPITIVPASPVRHTSQNRPRKRRHKHGSPPSTRLGNLCFLPEVISASALPSPLFPASSHRLFPPHSVSGSRGCRVPVTLPLAGGTRACFRVFPGPTSPHCCDCPCVVSRRYMKMDWWT